MSTSNDSKTRAAQPSPDQQKLTARQAARLSNLSGVDAKQLQGRSVAELATDLRWQIDPALFLFRRICG